MTVSSRRRDGEAARSRCASSSSASASSLAPLRDERRAEQALDRAHAPVVVDERAPPARDDAGRQRADAQAVSQQQFGGGRRRGRLARQLHRPEIDRVDRDQRMIRAERGACDLQRVLQGERPPRRSAAVRAARATELLNVAATTRRASRRAPCAVSRGPGAASTRRRA